MTGSHFALLRSARAAGAVCLAAAVLYGCGAPERLPSDLSMETSQEVLKERVIAPIKGVDEPAAPESFEALPRRKLIQVRHSPDSLKDQYFLSTLTKLLSYDPVNQDEESESANVQARDLTESEKLAITNQRGLERTGILVARGLDYENLILRALRDLDADIETALGNTVSGVGGGTLPIFGRNLTGTGDSYLEIPNDLIFVGGENGAISSKTALLKQMLENPEIAFAVRDMPLPEALNFLFGSVGLQATMSESVVELEKAVTISVQASAIAIIDSLLEQYELSIVYDPAIEVAQIYTEAEFLLRLNQVKQSIEAYNSVLKQKKDLARLQDDRRRVTEILGYVQLLLSGDDEGFVIGMESISRAPAGEDTSTLIADMTRNAIELRGQMANFDSTTASKLAGLNKLSALAGMSEIVSRPDLKNILSEDGCIWPRQEIFTEKVAIYNAVIIDGDDNDSGVVGKINNFFTQTRNDAAEATPAADADDADAPIVPVPAYCGTENPAPTVPIILPDDTGITVIGTREDNDLVVRLVEQYDVPELQVLIEIFIITVSRDFSRQIDSILSASPAAGGNNNQEVRLTQVARAAADAIATTGGSFALDLASPNDELGLLLNFLESNALGRVVSSPTILVASGQDAVIKRDQIARVPGPSVLDADNNTVPGQPVEYNAPFELKIREVDINRLNNTVKLDVELTDTRFNVTLANVNELSDRTSDVIDTTFWASPGDVVVLAGLTRNEEATATSGAPGTTGDLAPLSPLLGGSDSFSTNMSETLIFMAPTVIDPSAENQPHSAFRKKNKRTIVN